MMPAGKREAVIGLPKIRPIAIAIISVLSISATASARDAAVSDTQVSKETVDLKQITVTATGREAKATDIPYNISVVTQADLTRAGVTDIATLARQVPGLAFTDLGARSNGINNGIILRGLNANSSGLNNQSPAAGEQTVSTYINNTPLFSNLKIVDVERVEVLRGPQGTLYGDGSVGGTVRYILNKPDTSGFYGDIQTKDFATAHSNDPSYGGDLMLNMPVNQDVAFRLAAGYEKDAGYTDAAGLMQYDAGGNTLLANSSDYFGSSGVFKSKKDVDDSSIRYGRLEMLLDNHDGDSLLLTAHHQDDRASDYSGENPYAGKEYTSTRYRLSPSRTVTNMYSAEYSHDFGFATLTSSSSYSRSTLNSNTDYTNFGLYSSSWYAGIPRSAYNMDIDYTTKQYVQEFRLVSSSGGAWDWVLGAYYSDYKQAGSIIGYIPGWSQYANASGNPAAVAATGNASATWADYYQTSYPGGTFDSDMIYQLIKSNEYKNTAAYGELTRHINDKWQITLGTRIFHVVNDRSADQDLPFQGSSEDIITSSSASDTDHIFKFNTSYHLAPEAMTYFTWSQGYRPGGSNSIPTVGRFAANASLVNYKPDYATNWEIGLKGQFGGWLQYSSALFRVNWKDIQMQIPAPKSGMPTIINAGRAVSQGVEFESKAQISDNVFATFGYAYTDAHLTQDFTVKSGYDGYSGDRLPGVPRNMISGSLNYVQPTTIFGGFDITYRIDGAYRSGIQTALNSEDTNYVRLGGFTTWNASATWHGQALRAGVFVNNVTSQKGITAVDITNDTTPGSRPGSLYFTQRPRTIGVMVGYAF